MKKTGLQILVIICLMAANSLAQVPTHQDCRDAIPICSLTYTEANSYTGTGNYTNEINPGFNACTPSFSEANSSWYIITTQSAGQFGFLLTPNNPLADFNWAVYNQSGTITCSSIYTNSALALACNTDATPGNTGMCGGVGPQFGSMINATAGQTFVICISDMNATGGGFTLDFTCSSILLTDTTSPHMATINSPVACNATSINVRFTENVTCASTLASDFYITDPLNIVHTVTSVSSTNCTIGSPYDNLFTLTFTPALTQGGMYILHCTGGVTDLCGNTAVAQTLPFNVAGVTLVPHSINTNCGATGIAWTTIVSNLGPYTYLWSPSGATNSTISGLSAGDYTCTVHGASGCPGITICHVGDTNTVIEQLCIVSIDTSTQKNMLIWNKTYNAGIASYNILKETTTSGVYALLANQPFSTFSTYLDTSSQPQVVAARYKLQTIDSCGTPSDSGMAHKTIHLTVSQGIGNSWNLNWDAYEGITFPTYYILRGTNIHNMTLLDSVQSTIYAYTDMNPPMGPVYYAIELVGNTQCNPSIPPPHLAGTNMKSINGTHSRSNVMNVITPDGITEINNPAINIHQNSTTESLTIQLLNPNILATECHLTIVDVMGKTILQQRLSAPATTINISQLAKTMYFYRIQSTHQGQASIQGKFVKE